MCATYHPKARGFETFFGHTSGHWGESFDALPDDGRMIRSSECIVNICTARALEIPGSSVMDLRRLTLTLLP